MPRAADTYGVYYRESRARLLHQVYAYTGNTEVAQRSLADAFVAAGHHWRKLADNPAKDAWMRERAFRASARAQNRSRRPWYVNAMRTADEHRPLLTVLSELAPTDRKLVILRYLVGLDLPSAGREAGVLDSAAILSIEASLNRLEEAGVDTTPAALTALFDHLHLDLLEEPVDRANRLKREGNRRRRSHLVLAGVTLLAVAIGAGAVTAAQTPVDPMDTGDSGVKPAEPSAPEVEMFTSESLATADDASVLDPSRPWDIVLTSSDFGDDKPVSDCLSTTPTEKRASHYWVRDFSSGAGDSPTEASQALEIATSPETAAATYEGIVASLSVCRDTQRHISEYKDVTGIGDDAAMFDMQYVAGGEVRDEQVLVSRSGTAISTWVVRAPDAKPVRSRLMLKVAGGEVDKLCADAEGACSITPYSTDEKTPPADSRAPGFLSPVDLPLFGQVAQPWLATNPTSVSGNPSATDCDQADFAGAGAQDLQARTFVVPNSSELGPLFGMTETKGRFGSATAARQFVADVAKSVKGCEKRQLSLTVQRTTELDSGPVHGVVWEIEAAASETNTITYRVCLVRIGATVAEVTFTPSESVDVDHAEYTRLAERAAARMQQR